MKCPQCGNDNPQNAKFCHGCGASLGVPMASGWKEQLRDKSRDELVYALNSVGVKAEITERGVVEERAENSWYQRSLGTIDIAKGPIRWINILKKDSGQHNPPKWWVVLGIPDERPISNHQTVNIKTVRNKTFPLFGKVVDVIWKGNDSGTDLVNVLSTDPAIKTLSQRIGNLEIKNHSNEFQGWTLTVDRRFSPTNQDWETLEKVADHILSSPRRL